ncbi:phasin [Bradyrhizobium sp. 83012]|uniref:Phasin n=1 Tax=Bradyrhizobium aeschynomenes TaxID=2734909 RepID=A0ABX2CBY7_9BRAD|nr:phasin family protein [Bradyrhizobium aeschynomenes]NPU64797.1 phasin [Bradyrhizobium aeschynomenes]NPV24426.1 phasin [Bradyrhizobium aeschynomenes]
MTDDGRRYDMPKDMRTLAEAGFDQARQTFEKFLAGAEATAGSLEERGATMRAGAKDIGARVLTYAEKNVQSSLDYAQSLVHAKDLPEVLKLHSEFVQGQMRSLAEQAGDMGQAFSKAAIDATKPKA